MKIETNKSKKSFGDKLKRDLLVFFGFFIVTLMAGVYTIKYPSFVGGAIILLAFMFFNGVNIIVNLIIKSVNTILKNGSSL